MTEALPAIAIVGGTGALGGGLARRWSNAGYPLIIGSRDAGRAVDAAREIGAEGVSGLANADAAAAGDIVVVTVPYASQAAILGAIAASVRGKIVVDATVPLVPPRVRTVQMPAEGSAAEVARAILGADVRLVSAFHNVAAHKIADGGAIDCDVLVFGDDVEARAAVVMLVEALGLRGIHGGPLANSVAAEAMTSVLIGINRRYRVDGAGIRITGDIAPGGS